MFLYGEMRDERIFPGSSVNWERQSILTRIGDSARCNKIDTNHPKLACANIRWSRAVVEYPGKLFWECAILRNRERERDRDGDREGKNLDRVGPSAQAGIEPTEFMSLLSWKFPCSEVPRQVSLLSFQILSLPPSYFFLRTWPFLGKVK